MQGRLDYQPELFHTVNLEDFVPANHILRKIDKLLDLDFVYELTSSLYCSNNGRASIDPALFFRMQIIGYLFGIKSERQLCEEVHLNIAYRWFCRLNLEDKVPNHSSLTRIRQRFGESTFQQVFEHFIDSCLPASHQNRARFVYRNLHQTDIDPVRKQQTSVAFKSKLYERAWKVEGLFGEAKENHCLRRTKYRGLRNAQIQFYLTAWIQNLKRIVALHLLFWLQKLLMAFKYWQPIDNLSISWKVHQTMRLA